MGDDVNGARMSGIEGERATRYLFGTTILAVLLEAERVHRKDARVAGHRGLPFGQHLGDTIPHHAPLAEAKVERMCDHERENVARPVDHDGTVTFDRKSRSRPRAKHAPRLRDGAPDRACPGTPPRWRPRSRRVRIARRRRQRTR